jgi:hypothetical protein
VTVHTTEPARSEVPPRRRQLGYGLLAFGISGLVLIAAAGILLWGSLSAVNDAATGFERQRAEILAMLGPASDTLSQAASSAENAGTSLTATSDAATRAASMTSRLADSFESLASAATVEFLGTRPFGQLEGQFTAVASDARALSSDLTSTGAALSTNIEDSRAVATNLRVLASQLDALEVSLGGTPGAPAAVAAASLPIDAARLVLAGLLVWLAIPALASTWLGARYVRAGRPAA